MRITPRRVRCQWTILLGKTQGDNAPWEDGGYSEGGSIVERTSTGIRVRVGYDMWSRKRGISPPKARQLGR